MSEEQKPDTTEAVANAMYQYGQRHDMHRLRLSPQQDLLREAEVAIAAHDEELKRLGYVVVKPVRMPKDFVGLGVADLVDDLVSRGLPIEVEE